ncbi:unnamed protein product [Staphylococcus haemolyticus JCSC1435]|uniref:Uncharacterized protein n=1 Tax=Staphylococcus haemolyticus (strain JCSC1435) TaxID=279808 RepID=Q4L3Z9_STAHJ|nr:unnamed protein product [Staphylococcus haemolyticus JCSC1435]
MLKETSYFNKESFNSFIIKLCLNKENMCTFISLLLQLI